VPCVVDRLIQQALRQVLQERWDLTFSEHSYRRGDPPTRRWPNRSDTFAEGYSVVVDLDLKKCLSGQKGGQ
jgi:RNA-directed DNA polymerase